MTYANRYRTGSNLGSLAYVKPSIGLLTLRNKILGPEVFDSAFREYTRRWAFKHPQPADFFRTIEDVSGRDLDWFWRGWFFTTAALDQSVESVTQSTGWRQDRHPQSGTAGDAGRIAGDASGTVLHSCSSIRSRSGTRATSTLPRSRPTRQSPRQRSIPTGSSPISIRRTTGGRRRPRRRGLHSWGSAWPGATELAKRSRKVRAGEI